MPSLPEFSKANETKCDKGDQQLPLLAEASTESPIECYQGPQKSAGGKRYWQLKCRHTKRKYGGLYDKAECDLLIERFSDRTESVDARELGEVAAKILRGYEQ